MRPGWAAVPGLLLVACSSGGGEWTTTDPTASATGPTDADLAIVRLIQGDGGRLTINAAQMFGDQAMLTPALAEQFAGVRLRIATRLQEGATAARQELEPLLSRATAAAAAGSAGVAAFEALARCGREAAAFYRQARTGNVDQGAMDAAHQTCTAAQDAANEAERQADEVPDAADAQRTAGSEDSVTLTNRAADDPQAADVTVNVTAGQQLTVDYRLTNVGSFPSNLTKDCDGALSFDVTLIVAGSPPAVDVTQAGYSASGQEQRVKAKITGKDTVLLRLGTFPVTDSTVRTTVDAFVGAARCPNPVTGTPYTPTFDAGLPETLVLQPS